MLFFLLIVFILKNKLNQETESKKISIIQGALDFIYYIRDYWCGDLAIGWCKYGRIVAADLLQVPLEQIPTTNNHLESFNSELKVHQLQKYQNNGHLLRFDFLSVILVKSITPNILLKRTLKSKLQIQLKERYESYASFSPKERIQLENHYNQLVYYTPDSKRDEAAKHICKEKKIIQIEFNGNTLYLWVISDTSTHFEPKIYIIQLLPNITCQCMDFLSRGCACKHLRASILWINWLRLQPPYPKYYNTLDHQNLPYISLPMRDEAVKKFETNQGN
jgi:hypothetical protein